MYLAGVWVTLEASSIRELPVPAVTQASARPATARTPRFDLPVGAVTFLFTDVESSTALLVALGPEAYAESLAQHRTVVRAAIAREGGVEVDTQGDAFFVAFPTAPGALAAAKAIRDELGEGPVRLRMGIHTGKPLLTAEGYVGVDVHRAARIAAAGSGGQILVSEAASRFADGTQLVDLGRHLFKDFPDGEHVFQLGAGEFPPLRSLHRTNLPAAATPFIGREVDVETILQLLEDAGTRLVTLTGPGGIGKTRLALEVARRAASAFVDGVEWVPLASLDDGALVAGAVGHPLGVTEEPGGSMRDALIRALEHRRMLLLLDNCEHLVDDVAALTAAVLASCPRLVVVATSREPLAIAGEQLVLVDTLPRREAIELFALCARSATGAFSLDSSTEALVDELCARLDDLPLALELAAARVGALPLGVLLETLPDRLDLLQRPRDPDARHRTLRATIGWSYDLLDAGERTLFESVSVFAGGAVIEDCLAVCDCRLTQILSLVDKSLVRLRADPDGAPRYWMLEAVRAFAHEKRGDSDAVTSVSDRHCDRFAARVAEALPYLRNHESEWLRRFEPELANIRAALAHARRAVGPCGPHVAVLAEGLAELLALHGQYEAAEEAFEVAVAAQDDPCARAISRAGLGAVRDDAGRAAEAWKAIEEARCDLEMAPDRDAGWWRAWLTTTMVRGWHFYWVGQITELGQLLEEVRAPLARFGTDAQRGSAARLDAGVRYQIERFSLSAETEEIAREAFRLGAARDDRSASLMLGFCLLWRGKLDEAEAVLQHGLADARELEDSRVQLQCLTYLAVIERKRQNVDAVDRLLRQTEALEERRDYEGLLQANRAWVAWRRGDADAAADWGARALATWLEQGQRGPTVFQWTARFPLLGVATGCGDVDTALVHAARMIDPQQQQLPHALAHSLESALEHPSVSSLEATLDLARREGFA